MIYFTRSFRGTTISVRDIEEHDISTLVSYWHDSSTEFLGSIGVDVRKLSSREETEKRFRQSLQPHRGDRQRITLVADDGSGVVAYTNVNVEPENVGYVHVHTISVTYRGTGLVSYFFKDVLNILLSCFGLNAIRFQASTANRKISAVVNRRGALSPKVVYLECPDGMAKPGYFNIYEISSQ